MRILLILFLSFLSFGLQAQESAPFAKNGEIDLTQYDLGKSDPVALNGEWHIYWDTLIPPDLLIDNKTLKPKNLTIPVLWNNVELETKFPAGIGYATYHLKIKKRSEDNVFAFRIGRIETAYKFWINGKLVEQVGEVGNSKETSSPAWVRKEFTVNDPAPEIDLVIQVSNFYHRKGGIGSEILMGSPRSIYSEAQNQLSIQWFLVGVLLIMALYHFGLFMLDTEDKSTLYFGIANFATVLFMFASSEILLTRIFPDSSWNMLLRLNHVTNHLRLLFFSLFLGNLFSKEISSNYTKVLTWWAAITIGIILVTPPRLFTFNLIVFILVAIITLIYLIFAVIRATKKKRDGAFYSLLGTSVLLITTVNDAMYDFGFIHTFFAVPAGLFLFIFFQAFMLSLRSSRSKKAVHNLSANLMSLDKIKNQFLNINSYDLADYLKILSKEINSERSLFFLKKDGNWILKSEITETKQTKTLPDTKLEQIPNNNFAKSIIDEAIKTKETITCSEACSLDKYKDETYIVEHQIHSVLSIPILDQGNVKAILYFEHSQKKAFSKQAIKILDLLSSQIVTMIDNIIIYNQLMEFNQHLEEKIELRTREVMQQKEEIEAQRDELEQKGEVLSHAMKLVQQKNKEITDSINYAQRIQSAIFPSDEMMKKLLPQSFVFLSPKNILSGDFYWLEHVFVANSPGEAKKETIILAIIDCTGHGVPGALMSIIGNNLLNYAVFELKKTEPHDILDVLEKGVRERLKQNNSSSLVHDGMDAAIICIEVQEKKLTYSGAHNPILIVRENNATVLQANRFSIGGSARRKIKKNFTKHTFNLQTNDMIYLFSDGYTDQFGGQYGRKYMRNRFYKHLTEISSLSTDKQKEGIVSRLNEWKQDHPQIDDILVVGLKI